MQQRYDLCSAIWHAICDYLLLFQNHTLETYDDLNRIISEGLEFSVTATNQDIRIDKE